MLTKEMLYSEILNKLNEGCADCDEIAQSLNDGRVYEEIGEELSNVIASFPINAEDDVLEINGGCGIITGYLAKKCHSVDTVVFDDKQLAINKRLNSDFENIRYCMSLDDENESYDIVIIRCLTSDDNKDIVGKYKEYINYAYENLSDEGCIYIIFENRFSLESFNGKGRSDGMFTSLYEDEGRYISRGKIKEILYDTGLKLFEYYPYPNHKFTRVLFSEERLPRRGELLKYYDDNFSYSRYELFNETKVFDKLIDEGEFAFFSNSYVLMAQRSLNNPIIYAKYSTDRAKSFRIITELEKKDEKTYCIKRSYDDEATGHITDIGVIEKKLKKRFGKVIEITPSEIKGDKTYSPFIEGRLLQTILDECYSKGDFSGALSIVEQYEKLIYTGTTRKEFIPDEGFKRVFGDVHIEGEYEVGSITDIDLNFDNIIVNDRWNLIDYEWSFDFEIPQKYVLYRGLKYWDAASQKKTFKPLTEWFCDFNVSENEQKLFEEMENGFQYFVYGNEEGFGERADKYRKSIYTSDWINDTLRRQKTHIEYLENENTSLTSIVKKDEALLSETRIFKNKRERVMTPMGAIDNVRITENLIEIEGWAFISGFNHNELNRYEITFMNNSTGEMISQDKLQKKLRADLCNAFSDTVNIYNCGFVVQYEKSFNVSENDDYSIKVEIHNDRLKQTRVLWF